MALNKALLGGNPNFPFMQIKFLVKRKMKMHVEDQFCQRKDLVLKNVHCDSPLFPGNLLGAFITIALPNLVIMVFNNLFLDFIA